MNTGQLDGLVAFKLVADKQNFAAAAAILKISPSALSQAIKSLEARLGVVLLSRTTRTTRLTEAGQRFLQQAGPAIDQILGALKELDDSAQKPTGLLRLNMPRLVYPSYLAPIIASFTQRYPEVAVEVFLEDGTSDVIAAGFDAGIRLSDILARDMVATKLFGPIRFVTAGAPAYFAKAGRPMHPRDLLAHNCIRGRLGLQRLYDRWEFERDGVALDVQVRGSLIMNDSYLMVQAASDGMGIIYTMQGAIRNELAAGTLELVLEDFAATSAGFFLYYPKASQAMPKLKAFIEHTRGYGQ